MGARSRIEWCDRTWNPIVGCSVVSPGCANCYAMRQAARLVDKPGSHYAGTTRAVNGKPVWTGKVAPAPERIVAAPLRWRKPSLVFVNSMGDLFHDDVPDAWIDRAFAVMALAPRHTFQVLTKRAARMRAYMSGALSRVWDAAVRIDCEKQIASDEAGSFLLPADPASPTWPLPNVWLGVSAEDQARAGERIPDLLATPAAVRFVSAEPLLGPVDLTRLPLNFKSGGPLASVDPLTEADALAGTAISRLGIGFAPMPRLDWVIVGGESGPGARPMHPDWARGLRDQCAAAQEARSGGAATGNGKSPAFFFKQWGAWAPGDPARDFAAARAGGARDRMFWRGGAVSDLVGKKRAGRRLDGREWNQRPRGAERGRMEDQHRE